MREPLRCSRATVDRIGRRRRSMGRSFQMQVGTLSGAGRPRATGLACFVRNPARKPSILPEAAGPAANRHKTRHRWSLDCVRENDEY